MRNAFEILAAAAKDPETPSADLVPEDSKDGMASYVPLELEDHPAYVLLDKVERLFQQCGGAKKAFTTANLRKNMAPLFSAGNLGGLGKADLDILAVQYKTQSRFQAHDRALREASGDAGSAGRLFDFLDLCRKVSRKVEEQSLSASAEPHDDQELQSLTRCLDRCLVVT